MPRSFAPNPSQDNRAATVDCPSRTKQAIHVADLVIQVVVDDEPQYVDNKTLVVRNKMDLRRNGPSAGPVVDACREAGLLVLSAGERVLRLTPPLIVEERDCDRALAIIGTALGRA